MRHRIRETVNGNSSTFHAEFKPNWYSSWRSCFSSIWEMDGNKKTYMIELARKDINRHKRSQEERKSNIKKFTRYHYDV